MVKQTKILVGPGFRKHGSERHALRPGGGRPDQARVFILKWNPPRPLNHLQSTWVEAVLLDLVNSARQGGLNVSHHVASGPFEEEISSLIQEEGIDLVVFGAGETRLKQALLQARPESRVRSSRSTIRTT